MKQHLLLLLLVAGRCLPSDQSLYTSGESIEEVFREKRQSGRNRCGGQVTITEAGGRISSPGYPNEYPSNANCQWLLTAPVGYNIVLKIVHLELEDDSICGYDVLEVYAGRNRRSLLVSRLCGLVTDRTVSPNSNNVYLYMKSDENSNDGGFLIEYSLEKIGECETQLSSATGLVTSPGFPKNYPDNMDCWTLITSPSRNVISLNFDIFSLEYEEECNSDFVEIFDGGSKDSPSLGRFCSSVTSSIVSTTNRLLLHFRSDDLVNSRGFRATYTSGPTNQITVLTEAGLCTWDRQTRNGTIVSPNYPQNYPPNSRCLIKLQAPTGNVISVFFHTLEIQPDPECNFDSLLVKDGIRDDAPSLAKLCGTQNSVRSLTSTGSEMTLLFQSDDRNEYKGFAAWYWFQNKTQVTSQEKAAPKLVEVPTDANLAPGDTHVLKCVTDSPNAQIIWSNDQYTDELPEFLSGQTVVNRNTTLWIQSMNSGLRGVYTCTVTTPTGTVSASATIRMDQPKVDCAIEFLGTVRNRRLSEKEPLNLNCETSSVSDAQISWQKDGHPLEARPSVGLQIFASGQLRMDKARTEDTGVYFCIAKSDSLRCQSKKAILVEVMPRQEVNKVCGRPILATPVKRKPQRGLLSRIVGGTPAELGAYPWQVRLWTPQNQSFCGGTLLNERWVLTAAHCLPSPGIDIHSITVYLGDLDTQASDPGEISSAVDADRSAIHPDFKAETTDNDVALLRLHTRIEFSAYILPACLGDGNFVENTFFGQDLRMAVVSGWGRLAESGPVARKLQQVAVPVVEEKVCRETYLTLSSNMFCAGYPQEMVGDACQGDSGGPLIAEAGSRWYIIGIVSWGDGCGKRDRYGVYTKVSNYRRPQR